MVIDNNVVANVAYKIYLESPQGEMVEAVEEHAPREILFGKDNLIAGFEKGLMGKGTGDFSFEIQSEEAFGPVREELRVPVSKSAFMDNGNLRDDLIYVDNVINMLDQNGRQLRGVIKEIHDEDVLMDFNHPFAGKSLFVTGNILSLRSATEYDIDAHSGCGCGGGSCGCGSGGHHDHSHGESCCSTDSHGEEGCEACGTPSTKQQESVASR